MFDQGLRSPNRSSGDLNATLKQQLYENKLLASDNQIKTQQLDVLKEKIKELEDATNIYKKQLNNMEEKLRFSDQELKLKAQSSSDKSATLSKDNQYLHKKNQQLQGIIKELEDKVKSLELESGRSNKDADITRRKVVELEEQLDRARDKKRKTVGEIERISEAHKHATAENQDLSSSVERLTQENKRLLKVIDENEVQLKKLVNVQQEYCEIKLKYDNEFTESIALKQSYETLKQKYDEVYYNYNVSLANKRNDDSGSRSHTSLRVTELEQELKHLEAIISQKEREIMGLNETLRDYERHNKGEDIKFETDVKRIVNLIDGHTTTFEYTDEIESVALRLLMDNILRQNKEVALLNDKLKCGSQDIKELKQAINKLNEEKNVLRNANDELVKENNVLKSRIQFTVNDSIQNVNVAQSKFEERLQDMMTVQRDMEENFNQQLNQKDREIAYFKELLDGTSLKLRKIEEDRDQTLGFLKEQETEIKDFKNKFFHIAEETNQQQSKLNTTSYVLTSFLKILFNLMFKVEGLVQQKAFLVPYLNQYEKVYKKLAEMQLLPPKTQPQMKKRNIYRRFRRVILAISAVIKLRKLQQKNGGGNYDEFDVRLNLPDCSESLKRFLISLFRRGKFAVHRDLVASVGDVLKQVGRHSEDAIVSKLLDAASKHNEIEYEPPTKGKKKVMKEIQLSDLTSNFKIRDDFNSKLISLDGKLRDAEEYMLKQEQEFRTEVSVLSQKLREVNEEKENYRKEKDRLQGDYQKAKEQIDALLTTVDENQTILPASERKNRTLNEDYNILQSYVSTVVKKFDTAKKELEGKNMRIIELERQALYAGYPENNFVQSTPIASASKERFGKVPGRIFSSGRKKDEFSLFGNTTAKKERDHKFFS